MDNLYKTLDREYIKGAVIYYFGVELKEK